MIDIKRFLDDYNIEYWTSGKNVAEGFTNIQCPHCNDHSNHGGFTEDGSRYMCWRCGSHSVYDTLAMLIGVNTRKIYDILNAYSVKVGVEEKEKIEYHNTTIEVPGSKLLKQHKDYLESRNFDADYLERKYDLKGTLACGNYSYRIIVPVYYNNRIVTFQGRDFTGRQKLRYMMCEPKKEIIPIKNTIYNIDNAKSRSVLIVEGVYDVFRMGDNCISTFGTSYTRRQLKLISKKFDRIFVLFDGEPQAQEKALMLSKELTLIGKDVINLKLEKGDPAELSESEAREIKRDLRL